jgi:hypothetical protein
MLIDIFSDYIRNKKDLRQYIKLRKTINERGEFNDSQLLQIQENLERLKKENFEIYSKMYEVLEKVYQQDQGNYIEYPLNFASSILQMYKTQPINEIYDTYKDILKHKYQTVY